MKPRPLPSRLHLDAVRPYAPPPGDRVGELRLDANENTVGAPRYVIDALREGLTPHALATYPVYDAWQRDVSAAWGVPGERILQCSGGDEGIKAIFECFLMPGTAVVLPEPGFEMFEIWARLYGATIRRVPFVRGEHTWRVDEAAWRAALGTDADGVRPGMVCITSPNNPTGTLWPRDLIEETLERVDAPVIIDETYAEFADQRLIPLAARHDHAFLVRTFSKVHGLAGLRVGVLLAHPALIDALRCVTNPYNVNRAAVIASRAVLAHPDAVQAHVDAVIAGRDEFVAGCATLGLPTGPAHANFLLVDVSPRTDDIPGLVAALRAEGVRIKDVSRRPTLEGCVRVAMGPSAQMRRVLAALRVHLGARPLVDTLLLDIDGTLVDVRGSYVQATIETANTLLGQATGADPQPPVDRATVEAFKARGGLNNDWDATVAILAARGLDVDRDRDVVPVFQRAYLGGGGDAPEPGQGLIAAEPWLLTPATEAALGAFSQVGVVTGRPGGEARFVLDRHPGVAERSSVLVAMEDTEQGKPSPQPLLAALDAVGAPASRAVYVGDSVDDMRAAVSAGCAAVGVLGPGRAWGDGTPERLCAAGAGYVFADINQAIAWLAGPEAAP